MILNIQVVEYKFSYGISKAFGIRIVHQLTCNHFKYKMQIQLIDVEISRHLWPHSTEIGPQNHRHCDDKLTTSIKSFMTFSPFSYQPG